MMNNLNFDFNCQNSGWTYCNGANTLENPVGYSFAVDNRNELLTTSDVKKGIHTIDSKAVSPELQLVVIKRSWEATLAPLKALGMNFLMMYMSGSSSGIFGILIIGYALVNSVKSLFKVGSVFSMYSDTVNCTLQKSVYIFFSLIGICYIVYHCHSQGLLPVNTADYMQLIQTVPVLEKFV